MSEQYFFFVTHPIRLFNVYVVVTITGINIIISKVNIECPHSAVDLVQ